MVNDVGHHAPVMMRPTGDGKPLVDLDKSAHSLLAMMLQRSKLLRELNKMFGFLRFQFGLQGSVNAIDGLAVDLGWPGVREHVKRTTQSRGFKKRCELFPRSLHRFLDDRSRGVSQLSLKRRAVGQSLEQFSTRKRHFGIVHGPLDLLIDVLLQSLDNAPEFVLDSSDHLNF